MKNENPLNNIFYISLPENLELNIGDFVMNKDIRLPIETEDINEWNSEKITPESIISAMLKIMAYDQENENINYYRQFIKAVRPNIIEELTDSAIYKSQNNDYVLAKEIFLALNGLEPDSDRNKLNLAVLYENEAEWYLKKGNQIKNNELLDLSKQIYIELLNNEKVLLDTYLNGGYFFIKVKDFEKAELCLKAYIEYSDDEEKIKNAKKILRDYKTIINSEDILSKAYNLILNENEAEAINLLNEYVLINPNIWNAYFLIGWSYRRLSNFTLAIEHLNKALDLNKEDVDILNELSICYLENNDFDKSYKLLEKALKINPEDVKIISNLGIVELKRGNTEIAKKFFETVLVIDPDDNIAITYLQKIN